jgi:glycerophosphoryl diester phosphodiesterase
MGAGVIECDVTFTKDRELICRHSQCDLHTTTDVVMHPKMNAKCTTPWEPMGSPNCCASDFTLAEIKTLCAKMDSSGGDSATTAEEYVYGGTADWRTDLYQYECPKIPTHKEYIELIFSRGGKFTPELKEALVEMPYEGDYTQEHYAQQMIDEYIACGIPPKDVWPQSFHDTDVFYWIDHTEYGDQAVALDDPDVTPRDESEVEDWLKKLVKHGVKIVAPPLFKLVEEDTDPDNELGIRPAHYARAAQHYGLDIITWTLERSPPGK